MSRFPPHELTRGVNTYSSAGVTHTPTAITDPTDHTMPKLIKALGGRDAFEALPVLDLGACTAKGGGTGYIDFVRSDDMTAPIMRGEDEHGRPFVAFRIKTERREAPSVETLFRRYTEGPVWVSGGGFELCSSALTNVDLSVISELVSTGIAEYEGYECTKKVYLS